MSPRPTTGHVRRPAILKAAAEVIAERGVIGTRIADVAERAGTSAPGRPLLVRHQGRAADRGARVLRRPLLRRAQRPARASSTSARARLERLVEVWPAEGDSETVLWMELWVRALRDPAVNATRAQLDARWRAAIADVVREGQAAGEFGEEDPEAFALTLGALMDGFAIQLALRDPAVTPELVQRALHGARGGAPGTGGSH